ncbi:TetR/AcrR family transcriptional regulator [Micromonospora coxensis]|uniref:Transcriptional regulator, TetR family n=1 Tax=Micromonospora coxensis TaxID=356852 RepID=A0A1C5GM86_9ACTN|nr:TetR/AcrR family transcriptional regulator [Micromonospora coxensis]SCG34843.1 transcriptional regulator, TetR family [Micromonospora coxensis]
MSPKQQRGEATAQRLLDSALAVFEAAGQPGFTVHAVTAASGVSLGSLYHHFGSFDGLAAALYSQCMSALFDDLIAALTRARTARTGVRAIVVAYLRFTEENPAAARFIHASAHAGYLATHADQVAAAKAPQLAAVAGWLRPRMAAGEIATLPEPLVEMLMIGPVAETSRRWLAGVPGIDIRQAARVLPDRIWRSLAPD